MIFIGDIKKFVVCIGVEDCDDGITVDLKKKNGDIMYIAGSVGPQITRTVHKLL